MLLYPRSIARTEINANLGFANNQKIRNIKTSVNKKGNANPRNEMNHHLAGCRYGARQASKKIITTRILA
jgi:hypothetical protein